MTASVEATPTTPVETMSPPTATAVPDATGTPISTAALPDPTAIATPIATPRPRPARSRVTEDFDTVPGPPWYNPGQPGGLTASGGVLTLVAGAGEFNEVTLQYPSYYGGVIPAEDVWDSDVSNARGWWVEVRMRVDPLTDDQCASDNMRGPALTLWATDDTQMLVSLGFSRSCVALVYSFDGAITVPMDTTRAFHTYRISTHLQHVEVYIDGALAIQREYGLQFAETGRGLLFGDGQAGYGPTRSYWDYITYDVSGPSQ